MTNEEYSAIGLYMQERRRTIRSFLQTPIWTEEKLCGLLAHAETKLTFISCCCLIGVATANHALMGRNQQYFGGHYKEARSLLGAVQAEWAANRLAPDDYSEAGDAKRRRILRPIIRAEIRRRERLRQPTAPASALELAVV